MFSPHIMNFLLSAAVLVPGSSANPESNPSLLIFDDGPHEDPRIGFKMSTPKKWNQVPIQNDERWIVGRYQSDKDDHYTDKTVGWTFDHKAEMTMLAFTGESMTTDIDVDVDGKDGDRTVSGSFTVENPYKDYQEYLKKTYRGGGWYIHEEGTEEVRGVKVTTYSIKVEKIARGGPKRLTTWVYHLGHADVAVQFECLEEAYDKHKKEMKTRFKSFTPIERTETVNASSAGFKEIFNSARTPEERKEVRLAIEKEQHEKARRNLPEEWTLEETDRWMVVSHTKKKHTKEVTNQVGRMFDWLEKQFPYIGPEEYVRRPIIRICRDTEEMNLFLDSSGWSFTNIEILTCRDTSGWSDYLSGAINDRAFRYWFYERDRELYLRIPVWLRTGMDRMLHSAEVKGSRLIFEPDNWEKTGLREALRDGTITKPSEMFLMISSDMRDSETRYREFGAFVRYLIDGPGAKHKLTRNLVEDYLTNLKVILDEEAAAEDEDEDEDEDDGPMTEEEEDAAFKARQNSWKERASDIAQKVYDRTFADWTQKDWDALDKAYLKSIK